MAVQGGTHDFVYQIESSQGLDMHFHKTVPGGVEIDFAFSRVVLPEDTVAAQSPGQDGCGLVFMYFILLQLQDIEVVLPQTLKTAKIIFADGVALAKGGALELSRANFRDVVGQLEPHRVFELDGFHHVNASLASPRSRRLEKVRSWGTPRRYPGIRGPIHVRPGNFPGFLEVRPFSAGAAIGLAV